MCLLTCPLEKSIKICEYFSCASHLCRLPFLQLPSHQHTHINSLLTSSAHLLHSFRLVWEWFHDLKGKKRAQVWNPSTQALERKVNFLSTGSGRGGKKRKKGENILSHIKISDVACTFSMPSFSILTSRK